VQVARTLGNSLRAFQPTIRELQVKESAEFLSCGPLGIVAAAVRENVE